MGRTIAWSAMQAVWICASLLAMDASAAQALAKGSRRVYRDAGGVEWCVTVVALDTGVDGKRWAWFGFTHDPRRVEHVPSDELARECPSDAPHTKPEPVSSTPSPRAP